MATVLSYFQMMLSDLFSEKFLTFPLVVKHSLIFVFLSLVGPCSKLFFVIRGKAASCQNALKIYFSQP